METLKIVVHKARRTLEVLRDSEVTARMQIALGREPAGRKDREGDGRTPEGVYRVCTRNDKSKYHLALGLDYPNAADAARGLAEGRIDSSQYESIVQAASLSKRPPWDTKLGGEIMIHGGGTQGDWTVGCIAVSDADMDELWKIAEIGTTVEIFP